MRSELSRVAESYNELFPVTKANRRLEDIGGEAIVGKALDVIRDGGLGNLIGIRLLHKHNDIFSNEVMLETEVVDEEGFALITAATQVMGDSVGAPNSWQSTASGYRPSEFSDPALLVAPDFDVRDHERIFRELAVTLREHRAEHVLGPCVNYSKKVTERRPRSDAALLEKTDSAHRANVVRYVMGDDAALPTSSKTKWYAKQVLDDRGKVTWAVACSCFCSVSPEGGGHEGTTTHRFSGGTPSDKE